MPAPPSPPRAQPRLLSLDVFRGITIAGMILVNSAGNDDSYRWVQHAPWHGWTPADFVFPSFLFIMGVSVVFSLGRRLEHGESVSEIMRRVLRRTAIIFAFGLIVSLVLFHPQAGIRLPGVMQRIAVCYLFCSLLFLNTRPRTQVLAAAAMLAAYWLMMTQVPVPGYGKGILTPEGNLASYLDRILLKGYLYEENYDPEGIFSTIPALATSVFGVLAGHWLRSKRTPEIKSQGLFALGTLLLTLGQLWAIWFPLNKHIWTSSYALFNTGLAFYGLSLCYWLVEIAHIASWSKPFEIFGRNPLLAYFLSGLFYGVQEFINMTLSDGSAGNLKLWLCDRLFQSWLSYPAASLAYALCFTLFCLGLMTVLYRKRLFLKV